MRRATTIKASDDGVTNKQRAQTVTLKRSVMLIALAFSGATWAQSVPSVGEVMQSVPELRAIPSRPAMDALQFTAPEPEQSSATVAKNAARVQVTHFALRGNTLFPDATLLALLDEGLGKQLALAELEQLAARISSYYYERGYVLARAYIPAQSIKDGKIDIAVVEGTLGKVTVQRDKSVRLKKESIDAVLAQLQPGQAVHVPSVERALLLLTDLPGVTVRSTLRPGSASGTADLVVAVSEARALQTTLGFDNYGNAHTGRTRTTLGVNYNDLTGVGDQLSLQTVRSGSGLTSARLGYERPLGADGLRMRLSYADLHYDVGGVFEALGVTGDSQIYSAGLQYPLIRSRAQNLSIHGGLEQKYIGSAVKAMGMDSNKVITSLNLGLSGSTQDNFIEGGLTAWGASITRGSLDLRSPIDAALDAGGANTNGEFTKLNWNAMRIQRLTPRLSLTGSLMGQTSTGNLDSAEKFFLGGPNSVRAYPAGETSGDEGVLGTIELRYDLAYPGMQLIGFVDGGKVRYNDTPYYAGENSRRLAGAGLGIDWNIKGIGNVRASYAKKLGSRESDSDFGKGGQFWLSASLPAEALLAWPAPTAKSSASSRIDIYGTMDFSQEFVSRRGATPAGTRGATQSASPTGVDVGLVRRMGTNSSNIGIKGRERLATGLSLWYQLEANIGTDLTDSAFGNRNSGMGITSTRWGTLMGGLWDAPYKSATSSYDPFSGKYFNSFYTMMGTPGLSVSTATTGDIEGTANAFDRTDAAFTRRQGNVLQYWSPKINGISGRFGWSGQGTRMAPQTGEAEMYSASLTYQTGPYEFSAAYERHDNYFGIAGLGRNNRGMGSSTGPTTQTWSKDDALKLAASYRSGPTRVGIIIERLSYREYGVEPAATIPDLQAYQRDAVWIGISHRIGNYRLKGAYGVAEKGKCNAISLDPAQAVCSTDGLGAEMLSLGVEYNFSRRTGLYANYGQVNNRPSSNYNFGPGGVFGAGVGSDLRGISIGMTHRF